MYLTLDLKGYSIVRVVIDTMLSIEVAVWE